MTLTTALLSIALASNGGGKTLVRQQQGTIVPSPGVQRPLISDDANTLCHPYFTGATIKDTKGCAWAMTGTVPQVAKALPIPGGAGPFITLNYYSQPLANPINVAGTVTACIVFASTGSSPSGVLLSVGNGTAANGGWIAQSQGTAFRILVHDASAATANAVPSTGVSVGCVGVTGANSYAKLNLGTIATVGLSTLVASNANTTTLGLYAPISLPFPATIIEAWVTSTAPSDALFIQVMTQVKTKLGISSW